MENAPHIISGSLRVGPFAEERPGAGAEATISFLDVLCRSLCDDSPVAVRLGRENRLFGGGDASGPLCVFIEDAIRAEPPVSSREAEESVPEAASDRAAGAQNNSALASPGVKVEVLDPTDGASGREPSGETPPAREPTTSREQPSEPSEEARSRPEALSEETEQPAKGEGSAPPETGHGVAPEAREGAAHDAPLAGVRGEEAAPHVVGSQGQVAAVASAGSADAVSAVGNAAHASNPGVGLPGSLPAADAEGIEKLDGVFKEALSKAGLPDDLRGRIELARSIGRQVIRNAFVSVKDGRTEVTLQLRPPTLGTVRMQLTTEGHTISAKLSVNNALVREVVEEHLSQLRTVLRDEGFTLARFEVSVRSETGAEPWASARAEGHSGTGDRADADERGETPDETAGEAPTGSEAVAVSNHDGTVDYLA